MKTQKIALFIKYWGGLHRPGLLKSVRCLHSSLFFLKYCDLLKECCMFVMQQLFNTAANPKQSYETTILRRGFSHSISSSVISGCCKLERAALFLLTLLVINKFLQMQQPVKKDGPAKQSSCSEKAFPAKERETKAMPLEDVTLLKEHHKTQKDLDFVEYLGKPFTEILNELFLERDCKNRAYYFILRNGHFDQFTDYCRKEALA